ncbi:sigma 54 modulation/S30EA ribosomal C-terminal domain-containing protein [Actinophytocola oryzae]|uniref:sigma 54 modulation/S30EA ribosomal C-terminal domain-containing protein n=1 Tax=Actinophytocola oryzae TaxID=502181 RepID=UPI001FB8F4DE|nr:sigma 54 modulation/S30EA ribosomal C-terminal domain-containing protein [Actinophytocola oryzae]
MSRQRASGRVVVETVGDVLDGAREYARRQVAGFCAGLSGRLAAARVKLTVFARPSVRWPALAQANVEVDGQLVRTQVAAAFFHEASRLLRERLGQQVTRLSQPAVPRPWPVDVVRPEPVPRPVGEREVVRYKAYPLARCTPDRAALTMDVLDYDFHLFVDADTGQDSVICRVGPTGYRLARLVGMAPPAGRTSVPLTINVYPVPELTAAQAVERLNDTELPYRFFRDAGTGRGCVLYRRYDGHYGLISPEESTVEPL